MRRTYEELADPNDPNVGRYVAITRQAYEQRTDQRAQRQPVRRPLLDLQEGIAWRWHDWIVAPTIQWVRSRFRR